MFNTEGRQVPARPQLQRHVPGGEMAPAGNVNSVRLLTKHKLWWSLLREPEGHREWRQPVSSCCQFQILLHSCCAHRPLEQASGPPWGRTQGLPAAQAPCQLRVAQSSSLSFITDFLSPARGFPNLELKSTSRRKSKECSY